MDGNFLLLVLLVLSAVPFLITAVRMRARGARPQMLAVLGILAITGILYLLWRDIAGYVGGALWGVFFLTPTLAMRWVQHLSIQRRYRQARLLCRTVRLLQPWGGWPVLAATFEALELARTGRVDEAIASLQRLKAGPLASNAHAEIARITGHWDEFLAWVRSLPPGESQRHVELVPTLLRALGETGAMPSMLATYMQFEAALSRPVYQAHLRMARLVVLVFCGRVAGVERFCDTVLRSAPAVNRRFWVARARLAAGQTEEARREFEAIANDARADDDSRVGATRVLSRENPAPVVLDATDVAVLEHIEVDLEHAVRYGGVVSGPSRRPWMTWILVAANVAMFVVEVVRGGSEDGEVLYRLGALVPEAVAAGEWWRIGTAMFLHFGIWHIGMNMLGLLVLGPFLERAMGWVRFSIVYLTAGLLSMYCAELVAVFQGRPEEWIAGASGAIMALVGGTAAWMLDGWRRDRARLARARLMSMLSIVVLQAVFDWIIPQVSFTAHFAGAVFGFLVAWLLLRLSAVASSRGRLQAA